MAKRSLSDGDLRHTLNDIRSTARPLARRDGPPPSRRLVTPTQNKRRRVYVESHEEKPKRKIAEGSWAMLTITSTLGQGKGAKRHNSDSNPDEEELVVKRRSVQVEDSAPKDSKQSSLSAATLTAKKPKRKSKKAKGKKKSKQNMLVRASPGSCDISMSQEEKIVDLEVELSALNVSSDNAVTNASCSHDKQALIDKKETCSSPVSDLTVKPIKTSFLMYRLPTIKVSKAAGPVSKIRAKPAKRIAEKDIVQED